MRTEKNNILVQASRIPVLVLYSLFFTVQVFFNFDTSLSRPPAHDSFVLAGKKDHPAPVQASQANKSNKAASKIRLNKRFQPSSAPAINPFSIAAPVCFTEQQEPAIYKNPFYLSSGLFTRTLRGPPAVVYCFL